jgi:transcriptional regulator GlxA family with amidase domain
MKRRQIIGSALALAGMGLVGGARGSDPQNAGRGCVVPPLRKPERGRLRVGFLISEGSNVIDMAGPWEVFQDVMLHEGGMQHPFELYTLAESREPVRATGGLRLVPEYTLADAPAPDVVVVPAMRGSKVTLDWLRRVSAGNHLTMSVCTGAFQLGRAGLLDGLTATTHHDFQDDFAQEFPAVRLVKDVRFVEHDRIATAAGLTSGVDLALRVVERYYGRAIAQATAEYMEHESEAWKVAQVRRSSRIQVYA